MAGVGGTMPSLSKLGSVFVTDPSTPLPEIGLYIGLLIFFVIGVAICVGFQEWRLREAFILGICGPALITNILSGVGEGLGSRDASPAVAPPKIQDLTSLLFQPAYAQTVTPAEKEIAATDVTFSEAQLVVSLEYAPQNVAAEVRTLPIDMAFLGNDGEVLFTSKVIDNCVDQRCPTTVAVPTEASTVRFQLEDHMANVKLPNEPFAYAFYNLRVEASWNDFLWTLGFSRTLKIKTLTASEISIVSLNQEAKARPVGFISNVEGGDGVQVTRDNSSLTLERWDPVYLNDSLETTEGTTVALTFNDNTILRLGGSTRVTLESFVQNQEAGLLQLNLTRGIFRFVSGKIKSGKIKPKTYKIRTPTGTIAIRG